MRRQALMLTPFLAGLSASPVPNAPVRRAECETVAGSIEAHVDALRPAVAGIRFKGRGSSAGDLAGTVAVNVVRRIGDPRFEADFSITTGAGQLDVAGIAHTGKGVEGVYPVRVTLNVDGGTGTFEDSEGSLAGTGIADKTARTMSLQFTGKLCRAESGT
jgi:hypothetical protein